MSIKNKLLSHCSKNTLARNNIFKGRHKGESCYIFGNGISIKDMDLRKLDDKISIGCTYLWLHKDFDALDARYYAAIAPFWFYPFWRHSRTGKLVRNPQSAMQKRILKQHPQISFFTSLSNRLGVSGDNVYYLHHFDVQNPGADMFDMAGAFFFRGVVDAMIGMAIYMGFESAYLVGCDYTQFPQRNLHFYEKGQGTLLHNDTYNADFFRLAEQHIDLTTVTTNGAVSKVLNYVDYKDLTGVKPIFRENTELVKKEYLDVLAGFDDYLIY